MSAAGVTHLFDLAELLLHLMVDSLRLDQLLLQIRTDTRIFTEAHFSLDMIEFYKMTQA